MNRLSRWSGRKRGEALDTTEDTQALDGSPAAPSSPPASEAASADPASPSAVNAPATAHPDELLPDPDSLPPGSDIKAFLAPEVSAGLRRRALRRLFAAEHYNLRDGLDDYDDDYRQGLQPLAEELAQRLRRWTAHQEAPEHAEPPVPDEADHARETTSTPDQTAPQDGANASKPSTPPQAQQAPRQEE